MATGIRYAADTAHVQFHFQKTQEARTIVELAEKGSTAFELYFTMLDEYSQYRAAELRSVKGFFPNISEMDRNGEDYACFYVTLSKNLLESPECICTD